LTRQAWDFDLTALHGPQGMTDEDRAYRGSRYADVRAALLANPYRPGRCGETPGPLPLFKSTIANAWAGIFTAHADLFKQASARSVDSRADLRWGPDGKGFRRIIAPNGICLCGTWEITVDTAFTGYFKKGARGLVIGRYSSDGSETRRGQRRSLSLAGKIYPTTDPDHANALIPASFVAQEDLGGMHTDAINDAELRNEPDVTAFRRGIHFLIMLRAGILFRRLDRMADIRQLHEIAELGKPAAEPTRTPRHMRLKMAPGQRRIDGDGLDFRDEIYAHLFTPGQAGPAGSIAFDISVSDAGQRRGLNTLRRVIVTDWQPIGRLTFTEAVASYNGDHVIHFHHPGWRDDRNDRATAIRKDELRVRR
jgi:hypothetical protein